MEAVNTGKEKTFQEKEKWRCSSVVEHLPSMYKALGTISNTTKRGEKKERVNKGAKTWKEWREGGGRGEGGSKPWVKGRTFSAMQGLKNYTNSV